MYTYDYVGLYIFLSFLSLNDTPEELIHTTEILNINLPSKSVFLWR